MTLQTNLINRDGMYYFRARVPTDLVARCGRAELKRSLGTKVASIARRLAARARTQADALFEHLRKHPMLTDHEIAQLVRCYYQNKLSDNFDYRQMADLDPGMSAQLDEMIAGRRDLEKRIIEDIRRGRIDLVDAEAQSMLYDVGLEKIIAEDGITYRKLCQGMLRALLETTRRAAEEDEGVFGREPTDPMIKNLPPIYDPAPAPEHVHANPPSPQVPAAEPAQRVGPGIKTLVEPFVVQKALGAKVSEKTQNDYRASLGLFMQVVGEDRAIATITPDEVVTYKDMLLTCPTNFRKRLKTDSLTEAVRLNAARPAAERLDTLDPKTINEKYLSNIKAFFDWAKTNKKVQESPATGVRAEQPRRAAAEERDPFSIDDLKAIFSAPLYTGCLSDRYRFEPGDYRPRDHRYWAPLLALYTGCRLNEIGQLTSADIATLNDMPHFVVTDEGDGQRLKSNAAKRWIPVHRTLIDLGFMEHVTAVGNGRLFPDWEKSADGYYSSAFSKWFSRFLAAAKVKTAKKSFHSFRHSFRDAALAARFDPYTIDLFMGHEDGVVQRRYGSGKPVKAQSEDFHGIDYDGLDLGHLRLRPKAECTSE